MNQQESNLAKILVKCLNNECNDSEKEIINAWLLKSEENQKILDDLMNAKRLEADLIQYNSFTKDAAWRKLESQFQQNKPNVLRIFHRRLLYVASIVLVIFSISFLYVKYNPSKQKDLILLTEGKVLKGISGEILPATTGAILVKSNGEQVALDKSFNLGEDGSIKLNDEDIVIDKSTNNQNSYYELIVPKAKIIQFAMFDGSKIWVNANSRLQIPTISNNGDRKVKLIAGEIYLEVAKYRNSKFFVETQNGSVEVLGTKFNVNASDKSFKTTLLEGKVKLINQEQERILEPNTSGIWRDNGFIVAKSNLDADLAWKNNVFYFNNFSINRIARQIEDWYGVKVKIDPEVSNKKSTFSGEIPRDVPLVEVRKMLEFISGLQVSIEGQNLTVENK